MEFRRHLAEVNVRSVINAYPLVQKVKLVEVHRYNLLLGVPRLELHRNNPLLGLLKQAFKAPSGLVKHLLRKLLRNGGSAPVAPKLDHGACQGAKVDSAVL